MVLEKRYMEYIERNYRNLIAEKDLESFQVILGESDLFIRANKNLKSAALDFLLECRDEIKKYIYQKPLFKESLEPVKQDREAAEFIQSMILAGKLCGVGPMAAVAGAVAENVGKKLLQFSPEVIVENGGDIFVKSNQIRKTIIFAGESPLSQKVILNIDTRKHPLGVCTSSGTVGPSLSFGRADAVTIISKSTPLADAAATAIGNIVRKKEDINYGLSRAKRIKGVVGAVIIKDDKIGFWGDIDFSIKN